MSLCPRKQRRNLLYGVSGVPTQNVRRSDRVKTAIRLGRNKPSDRSLAGSCWPDEEHSAGNWNLHLICKTRLS